MHSEEHRQVRFYTDNIRTFAAVSELGGLGRAARSLGLSQPSVSQQISRLEALIGRKLFKRGKGGVALTPDGAILLRHAQSMIEISDAIGRSFGIGGGKVRLNVGITEMHGLASLHRVLWMVAKQNPDLSLRIVQGRTEDLEKGFDDGEFDVVVSGPLAASPQARRLRSEPLVWIGRADAPRPIPDPVPLILPLDPSRLRTIMLTALEQAGRSWVGPFEVSSVALAEAAIDAGFGYLAALRNMPLRTAIHLDARHGLPALPSLEYSIHAREYQKSEFVSAFCKLIEDAGNDENSPYV